MPRRARIDWAAVSLAAPRQVISLKELAQLGVSPRTIAHRAGATGPWQRTLPGVLVLHNGEPSSAQLLDAALRYAGPDSVLTGSAGARCHGLSRMPRIGTIHVLIPEQQQRASHSPVLIERTIRMPASTLLMGMPVAPLERCVIDCTRRMRSVDDIRALVAEAVQRGKTSVPALRMELESGSDRGSALPRSVLREVSDGVHSAAEAWARRLVSSSDLPKPEWNVCIYDQSGRFLAMPDAWFDEVALAWEIDSYEFHLSPRDYARTLERRAIMTTTGVEVLHTIPSRIRTESAAVLAELKQMYSVAAGRPRPPIRVQPRIART